MSWIILVVIYLAEICFRVLIAIGVFMWKLCKVITKYALVVLYPVYRFLFKAIPVTMILTASLFAIFLMYLVVSKIQDNNISQSNNICVEENYEEKQGLYSALQNRVSKRVDTLLAFFDKGSDKLFALDSEDATIVEVVMIVILLALLPILVCLVIIIALITMFLELIYVTLIIDTIRHICRYKKYRFNVKEELMSWVHYALDGWLTDDSEEGEIECT